MQKFFLKNYICTEEIKVIEALTKIDENTSGILFVVNENDELLGSLSDGDLRRDFIKNGVIDKTIKNIYNKSPKYVYNTDVDNVYEKLKEYNIPAMPVLDCNNKIVDIIFANSNEKDVNKRKNCKLKNIPVIIMAGGKGTRLYPYTKILPKPLIPIRDVPILERIINEFVNYDVENFYITVNYKKKMIISHFDELDYGFNINFIEEDIPLGTAGAISLIKKDFNTPVIVTNCDILIKVNYEKIYDFHNSSKNDITIVGALKKIVVPYGVLKINKECIVDAMEEKPVMSFFVNTGMYVVNPDLLKKIPSDRVYHMTDLVSDCKKEGNKIGAYPISEDSFLDMGEISEMKRMEEKLERQG